MQLRSLALRLTRANLFPNRDYYLCIGSAYMSLETHNKALLAQAAPAGRAYCVFRPKAERYVSY
jgi:hypothetical protein